MTKLATARVEAIFRGFAVILTHTTAPHRTTGRAITTAIGRGTVTDPPSRGQGDQTLTYARTTAWTVHGLGRSPRDQDFKYAFTLRTRIVI